MTESCSDRMWSDQDGWLWDWFNSLYVVGGVERYRELEQAGQPTGVAVKYAISGDSETVELMKQYLKELEEQALSHYGKDRANTVEFVDRSDTWHFEITTYPIKTVRKAEGGEIYVARAFVFTMRGPDWEDHSSDGRDEDGLPPNSGHIFIGERSFFGEDEMIDFLAGELAKYCKDNKITAPSVDELLIHSRRIDCSDMIDTTTQRRGICSIAKRLLHESRRADSGTSTGIPVEVSEGWLGLREMFYDLCISKDMSVRDSLIFSNFAVPAFAGQKKTELRSCLVEMEGFPDLDISQPAFNAIIRRNKITNTDLGRLGESFTHRLLSASLLCYEGPASSGVCDLSDRSDGDPAEASWAVNVKVSLEDQVDRSFGVSPEHQVSESWVLLLMPRALSMRLYPIAGHELVTVNSRSGGLCVTPEELGEKLKGLIES